jgi:putative NADPH-quinone reductase
MKAVIYFTMSKKKRSMHIAQSIEGDTYELLPGESRTKFFLFQLLRYGFMTVTDKKVPFAAPKIDFDQYDEVVLVFPIWAGRMAQYMKEYVKSVPFTGKKVTLIATSDSGSSKYASSFEGILDESNEIVDIVIYKKNQIQ